MANTKIKKIFGYIRKRIERGKKMKTLELEGFGKIMLNPIDIKDSEAMTCDSEGNPVQHKQEGNVKRFYANSNGVVIPNNMVCMNFNIYGDEVIAPKLNQTKEIARDDIEVSDENSEIYNAIERKVYNIFTDSQKLKDLLKNNKVLKFPFVAGNGWKVYNAVLSAWKDRIVLICCRGDINKALDEFNDDTVEFEIDLIPQNETAKKLLKAVAYTR